MKKLTTLTLAASALALSAGAASAQTWISVSNRLERLDDRIDVGVRTGDLTRAEAMRLRAQFDDLARLEARYRAGGLTAWERNDLDRRYDQLAMRVRFERRDSQERWNAVASTEVCRRWWRHMRDIMPANPDNSPESRVLDEVFHIEAPDRPAERKAVTE